MLELLEFDHDVAFFAEPAHTSLLKHSGLRMARSLLISWMRWVTPQVGSSRLTQ